VAKQWVGDLSDVFVVFPCKGGRFLVQLLVVGPFKALRSLCRNLHSARKTKLQNALILEEADLQDERGKAKPARAERAHVGIGGGSVGTLGGTGVPTASTSSCASASKQTKKRPTVITLPVADDPPALAELSPNLLDVADEPVAAVEADAAVEAAKATFRNVRPLWTQAAQEAEDKANTVKNAAEQRAAAEREKDVRAANKARAQEEYKAAKQGQKEQKALEEARQQAADDEARVKVAAEQERVLHRQTQRIRKAMEKEADALRQAEAREHAARMKAAQLAASRTEAMLCACGGELMVAPDEMQTLERYVPDFQNKTAEQLAEVLPTLRMGAWLQGGKRLFDGKSSGDAAPASIGVA